MNWKEVCENKGLQNLPFKIELNEYGKIVMTPVKVHHSLFQGEISTLLRLHRKDGRILTECAISTTKGTKVADVAWASKEVLKTIHDEVECSVAPEVCIEVLSTSNTGAEILDKRCLYFSAGAKEVWVCDKSGEIGFFGPQAEIGNSILFPEFPKTVDIDF